MNKFEYRDLKTKNYFEGWYLRITDVQNNVNLAFIFAITKDEDDPHAFIQIYDGVKLESTYFRFDVKDFKYKNETVYIKENTLSMEGMNLNIDDFKIDISLDKKTLSKKKNKSAMSYMSKFPLECFQEVNIIDGSFKGELHSNNVSKQISGKTYMEKTYGNKFPQNWIWIQSNHFDDNIALTFAYGKIPLLNFKVKGFFAILNFEGKDYRFGSYNLSRLKINRLSDTEVEVVLKRFFHKLYLKAEMINPVKLVGPLENGKMNLDVFESINSIVSLKLSKMGNTIIEAQGKNVGFELVI